MQDAKDIGPNTDLVVRTLIEQGVHPLMFLRRCQGILRLAKRHSARKLELACAQILEIGIASPKLKEIEGIIINHNRSGESQEASPLSSSNPFLRGQQTFSLKRKYITEVL
jgi:hypothetical protein